MGWGASMLTGTSLGMMVGIAPIMSMVQLIMAVVAMIGAGSG